MGVYGSCAKFPKVACALCKPCRDRWVVVAAAVAVAVAFIAITAMEVHDSDSSATCKANHAIAPPFNESVIDCGQHKFNSAVLRLFIFFRLVFSQPASQDGNLFHDFKMCSFHLFFISIFCIDGPICIHAYTLNARVPRNTLITHIASFTQLHLMYMRFVKLDLANCIFMRLRPACIIPA